MDDFLSFRRMITPIIVEVLSWIGLRACAVAGIYLLAQARHQVLGVADRGALVHVTRRGQPTIQP
jgi:hypothetical protein